MAGQNVDLLLRLQGEASQLQGVLSDVRGRLAAVQAQLKGTAGAEAFAALEEAAGRIDQDLTEVTETLKDTEASVNSLTIAAEKFDAAERHIAQLTKTVEELERAASEASGVIGVLSEKTKTAAESGSDASRRIAEGIAAFGAGLAKSAEGVRAADLALEAIGRRQVDRLLGSANTEAEKTVVLFAQVASHLREVEQASQKGLGAFDGAAARARGSIDQLRAQVNLLGKEAGDDLRAELARLERQMEETFESGRQRAKRFEDQLDKTTESLHRMTAQERLEEGQVLGLRDALIDLGGVKAVAAVAKVTTAFHALRESVRATRDTIDFLREAGIVDVDKAVSGFFERQLDVLRETEARFQSLAFGTGELANAIQLLEAAGEPVPDTFAGIQAAIVKLAAAQEKQSKATFEQADALKTLREEASGIDFDKLKKELELVTNGLLGLAAGLDKPSDRELVSIAAAVSRLRVEAREAGAEVDQKLVTALNQAAAKAGLTEDRISALAAELERLQVLDDVVADFTEVFDLAARAAGATDRFGLALSDLSGVSQQSADQVIAAVDGMLAKLKLLGPAAREQTKSLEEQLLGLRERFYTLGSEYEKSQKEALEKVMAAHQEAVKKRIEQEKAFVSTVKDLLGQLADAVEPQEETGALKRRLADKRAEIAAPQLELESRQFTNEEEERLIELQEEERKLARELRQAAKEATEEWGGGIADVNEGQQRALNLLRDLVAGNEAFRAGYGQLDAAAQEAVDNILFGLQQSAAAGVLAQEDLSGAARAIREVFQRAGIDVRGFSSVLEGGTARVGDLREALGELKLEGSDAVGTISEEAKKLREEIELLKGPPLDGLREALELMGLLAERTNAVSIGLGVVKAEMADLPGADG